ncbi:hypothetical protein M413DRAFT_430574 [Hebeloma cylindrosporum]|uniref:Protein kinase domain-containing protein n=1 Tax=Hebeloma cylindrosporum TaxID=76867 RepID=A0A0C3BW62_HEBCY|nr:hypothetical protein M413DRAFT_430574 [Hebeloma cylindrosporum h7]
MSFPEEASRREGPGHFPAKIHQKLFNDKYEIIRKLGYGPRSSTWLVWRKSDDRYFAVKIYTIAASTRAEEVEIPILQSVGKFRWRPPYLSLKDSFWERAYNGSHFCIITSFLSTTVEDLRLEEETHKLPVDVVQRVVYCVCKALKELHGANIMHGAVNAGNVYFSTGTMRPKLDSEDRPSTTKIGKFYTVASQPLKHRFRWRDKTDFVSEWPLHLVNLGHGTSPQKSKFKPEPGNDYLSAPETLSQNPSVSPKTDMWQLGCMILKLLTGSNPPFIGGDDAYSRLASIQAALGDGSTKSIEALLVDVLDKRDAAEAAGFIRDCLRLDPSRRLTADQALRHMWLADANLG